jgi:hypothetical protein
MAPRRKASSPASPAVPVALASMPVAARPRSFATQLVLGDGDRCATRALERAEDRAQS